MANPLFSGGSTYIHLTSIYGFRGVLGIPGCTWSHSKDKLALIGLLLYVHRIDQPGFIVHETVVINIISLKTNRHIYSGLHRLDCPPRGGRCIAVKTVRVVPSFLKANTINVKTIATFGYLNGFLEAKRCHKTHKSPNSFNVKTMEL